VIDSLNLSTGIGLLVLKAAELQQQECSADEIQQQILASIPKVRTSFVVETMEYLYKGGRCTAIQALMGSMLKIRPIIEVHSDGTLGVKAKARGTRAKALQMLLDDLESHLPGLDRHRLFVTHSGCQADAEYLAQEIRRIVSPDEVRITLAGSVISSHCGPDTIGILYLMQ
jgi:DegV family protein with EDD domain